MRIKKIASTSLSVLLTIGASITLGFLSFGGILAFSAALVPLAIGSFFLSTAYEAEIYFQNIKNAFKKLFQPGYFKKDLTNKFLLNHFPETSDEDCPQFFIDYERQLHLLKKLKKQSKYNKSLIQQKKQAEKTLNNMDKWFSSLLFHQLKENKTYDPYKQQVIDWLDREKQKKLIKLYRNRNRKFLAIKIFSFIAGIFMAYSTSFLFAEVISTIPFLTNLFAASAFLGPSILGPLLVLSGISFALLTYNAITDLIQNEVIQSWFRDIKKDLHEGFTLKNVGRILGVSFLILLATALTLCTAGTWWTIAKKVKPLFSWMSKIPGFFMKIVNPIILALSEGGFNIANSYETYSELTESTKGKSFFSRIKEAFKHLTKTENLAQKLNPFRLLLKITVTPIRMLLFLGHLASIAVTADRVPGVSPYATAALGVIAEGFEDYHYFISSAHEHPVNKNSTRHLLEKHLDSDSGHSHGNDLPTKIIKILFSPLYLLAATWDWISSRFNKHEPLANGEKEDRENPVKRKKTFGQCCRKAGLFIYDIWPNLFTNKKHKQAEEISPQEKPSKSWKLEQTRFRIKSFEKKHFTGFKKSTNLVNEKRKQLKVLRKGLREENLTEQLENASKNQTLNKHRWFKSSKPTKTIEMLDSLRTEAQIS